MKDRVWITWEIQRRNRTLSASFNAKLYEFNINAPALLRYPIAIGKTIAVLAKDNPQIIFVQNPSLILTSLSILISHVLQKVLIIDMHNAGLRPLEGRYRVLNWVADRLCSWATLVIVSNNELERYVVRLGGRAISIPDPIPHIITPREMPRLQGAFNVLFICSWAEDEPYLEVLRAAESVEEGTYIYISGNSKGREQLYGKKLSKNIVLTGYVSEEQFSALLFACDCIMVLTRRENCLLCGAYEGVAAEKPLIISNTLALKKHFSKGCVYINNCAEDILGAIEQVKRNYGALIKEVAALKTQHDREFVDHMEIAEKVICNL